MCEREEKRERVRVEQQGNSYGISTLPRSLVSPEETVEPKVKKEKLQISLSIHPCLIDRCINSHNRWGCSNYSIGRVLNPLSKNKVLFLEESFFFVSIFHLSRGRNCNILKLKSIYGFFQKSTDFGSNEIHVTPLQYSVTFSVLFVVFSYNYEKVLMYSYNYF